MNKELPVLFFDNDGILVDTEHLFFEANKQEMAKIGVEYTEDDYKQNTIITNKGSGGYLKDLGYDEEVRKDFKEARNKKWRELVSSTDVVIRGVRETLAKLSKEYRMFVVTSCDKPEFDFVHKDSQLLHFFEGVFTSDDVKVIKPNPEGYLLAMRHAGVSPENAIIIEDAIRGVQAGVASGGRVVAIPSRMTQGLDFSIAETELSSITELPGWLEQNR